MKKVVLIFTGVILGVTMLTAGCASKPAEPAKPATQTTTGTVTTITPPGQEGGGKIVVQTPQGEKTFTVTPQTNVSLENTACPIEDAGKLVAAGNATYNCTIVWDPYYNAISIGIWKAAP